MKIVLNAVSAKMGGAATYMKNLARELASLKLEDEFIFFVPEEQARAIRGLAPNMRVIATEIGSASFWKRLWFDQVTLRRWVKRERVDLLFSTANFAMFACPCRQVLLVRNVLHFSELYRTRILSQKAFSAKLNDGLRRWLIVQSVKWADAVITPSQAMLDELRRYVQAPDTKVSVNHYGITGGLSHLPIEQRANEEQREWRLFFSSLYAEHKNLRTLLQAFILLQKGGVFCRLLTSADPNWKAARATSTWKEDVALLQDERLKRSVEFTGILNSEQMTVRYKTADLFIYPSAIESFGHPLIEAMVAGLPIVAADTKINRELCQDAALYFDVFNADDCADKITQALSDKDLRRELIAKGLRRIKLFTWNAHINRLLDIFHKTVN